MNMYIAFMCLCDFLLIFGHIAFMPPSLIRLKIYNVTDCPAVQNTVKIKTYLDNVEEKTQSINFNTTLPFDIDDSVSFQLTSFTKESHGKGSLICRFTQDKACEYFLSQALNHWDRIQKKVDDGEALRRCPIKKGKYRLDGYVMDFQQLNLTLLPVGNFITEFKMYRGRKLVCCKVLECKGG